MCSKVEHTSIWHAPFVLFCSQHLLLKVFDERPHSKRNVFLLRQKNVEQALGQVRIQLIIAKTVPLPNHQPVADKCCGKTVFRQVIGRCQLGDLHLDFRVKTSFLKQLPSAVVQIIARCQQKEL